MTYRLDEFLKTLRQHHRIWNLFTLATIKRYQFWDKLLSFTFKYSSRCYQRQGPLEIKKVKNPSKELKYFSDHFGRLSTSKTLIGKVTLDQEDLVIAERLLLSCYEKVKNPESCELATSEILAKVLAYRNLEKGYKLWIPFLDQNGQINLAHYEVEVVFDLWKKHAAFGLFPTDTTFAQPILLYRGTDFSLLSEGGRASIISDLDPEGPGRKLFYNSRSNIRQWLQRLADNSRHARVLGHSLGGVLATYTLLYEYEHLSHHSFASSYAFNPPGISEDLLHEWKKVPLKEQPIFRTFVTRGDIISKFGHLLGDVYEVSTDRPLSPVIAHEQLIFSQPVSYLVKIDNEKENCSPSRHYYSTIQRQTTSWAFRFGLKFLFPETQKIKHSLSKGKN